MKRKLLSVLLTLCLAFSLLPTAALADGETAVAKVGVTEYATLAEAVEKADSGATVTLLKDTAVSAMIMLKKSLTLNLNGHKLNNEGNINSWVQVIDNAKLTINGTVEGSAAYGRMNLGIATNNNGSLEINGGIYAVGDDQTVLHINGTCMSSDVTINGATINATNDNGIQLNGKGTFSITNSMITGGTGIYIKAGTLTLENTKVTGTLSPVNYSYNGNGANATGDAVVIDACNYPGGNPTIAIKSGEFTGSKAAIGYYQHSGSDSTAAPGTAAISITGGTFNTDVSAYVADGYILNNGTVEKLGETNAVAKVGDTYYKTLADAVAAADNNTVTLLKDVTADITIPAGKTMTLDLNGKTLTNVKDHTILNNGNLTITGAGTVDNVSHQKGALYNKGTVVVNGGTFDRSKENGKTSNDSGSNSWYTIKNVGSMTIHDGATVQTARNNTALGKFSSLVSNGYFNAGDYTNNKGLEQPILTIDGGTFRGGLNTIKNDDRAKLTINGGTFSNYYQAVVQNHNIAEITGGTFTAASDANAETYGIYNCGCAADIDLGTLIVSGGTFTGATYAVADFSTQFATVNISNGQFAGTKAAIVKSSTSNATIAISGGYFTSDPSAYKAEGKFVVASDKAGYSYMISGTAPTKAEVIVNDKTAVTVPTNENLTNADKTAIQTKTNIDGVAEAVAGSKDAIVKKAGVDASKVDATKLIEVEVAVDVAVSDVQKNAEGTAISTITFTAKPTATVKVDGTEKGTVPVSNDMLNNKPITVKLPLPAGFTPKQIKHTSSDGSVEYFLDTQKTGAKTFEIKDGCAVFTITKFSTFELSGKVTYVAPSYSGGSSSYDPTYSVSTPSKTEHGSVTVSPKNASKGDRVTVTVKPDSGYVLETLTVTDKNGNELTLKDKGNGKYTFTMPAGKVEVKATFMEDNSMLNFFYDVPNNAYFYEAVKWAVKNGITTGVGNNLFAPEQPCTRAQIVTFLWRAAGSPEPKGAASGMTDVVSGSYYEKAVAWAIENGITTGTTTSTFSPDATCTRAQAVTFLARALKAKAASAAEFSDVPTDSYFADAVAWAAANGVTEGIGGGLFGSDNDCTRGQIVTFLYRAYNK